MAAHTMVPSRIMIFKGLESILGLTKRHMKAIGCKIKCTAKVFSNGMMVNSTRANSSTTSAKDAESSHGRTVASMMENGKMVSSTGEGHLSMLKSRKRQASGKKERMFNGRHRKMRKKKTTFLKEINEI